MKESKNWCFTDFDLIDWELKYNDLKDEIRYICVGLEVCPKTKKQHKQGWIQFYSKKRMTRVKNILGAPKIHLEACKGSEYSNDKYCKKDGKFFEAGKFIGQGYRGDIHSMIEKIELGAPMLEVAQENPQVFIQYHNGLQKFKGLMDKKNRSAFRKVEVEFVTGPTGCGKTRYAMEQDAPKYKINGGDMQWFDGYDGEELLIIDEYSNDIKITELLGLLDGYQKRLAIKGGFTYANWTRVIITSNLRKEELHENAKKAHIEALHRRITKWTDHWPEVDPPPIYN